LRTGTAVNESFYIDKTEDCSSYLIRAKCCADGSGGSPRINLYLSIDTNNMLIVSKERFYWYIKQEGLGYTLSPAESNSDNKRVAVSFIFTAYTARPKVVIKDKNSNAHTIFKFMKI